MGADGHTASLFPRTEALGERERWVVRNPVAKLRTERLTFTYPIITRARHVRVLVAGADKAPAVAAVLEGPPAPERVPSQRLERDIPHLVWLVDRAAAKDLAVRGHE